MISCGTDHGPDVNCSEEKHRMLWSWCLFSDYLPRHLMPFYESCVIDFQCGCCGRDLRR